MNSPDLTTFGGRLRFAMDRRNVKSAQLAQVLTRQGFSTNRINIDQWTRIDERTWRGPVMQDNNGKWKVKTKGKGLTDSRGPYPMELQIIVFHLGINGNWLFIGGDIPIDPDNAATERSSEDEVLYRPWRGDTNTRTLINYVMTMNAQARVALIEYLGATNQIDLMEPRDG